MLPNAQPRELHLDKRGILEDAVFHHLREPHPSENHAPYVNSILTEDNGEPPQNDFAHRIRISACDEPSHQGRLIGCLLSIVAEFISEP